MKKFINNFKEIIKNSKNILITAHINPDGDAIGSGLATLLILNKYNIKLRKKVEKKGEYYLDKNIRFILEDKLPDFLEFLSQSFMVEKLENVDKNLKFDTVIILDSGAFHRIGKVNELIGQDSMIINIDHHISNNSYGKINYINPNSSSTSEIIYSILEELDIELDNEIAECIYTGIVNDTGNFSHDNVKSDTFKIAAKLIEAGVKNSEIIRNLYNKKTKKQLELTAYAYQNMHINEDKKIVYLYLPYEILNNYGLSKEDTEGLVDILRTYENCEVALFMREEADGAIKGSLRSNQMDINQIAEIFDGGGHKKAAGFKTNKSYQEILDIVLEKI